MKETLFIRPDLQFPVDSAPARLLFSSQTSLRPSRAVGPYWAPEPLLAEAHMRASILAEILKGQSDALVGRLTAAWVYTGKVASPTIQVPSTNSYLSDRGIERYYSHLPGRFTVVLGGLRLSSLGRTAVDIARYESVATCRQALDEMIKVGLTLASFDQCLPARRDGHGRISGARQYLREILGKGRQEV